jgi:hypothetical protein
MYTVSDVHFNILTIQRQQRHFYDDERMSSCTLCSTKNNTPVLYISDKNFLSVKSLVHLDPDAHKMNAKQEHANNFMYRSVPLCTI